MKIEPLSKNLMDWPEITAFCIELRKSFLKSKYSDMDDKEDIFRNRGYEGKENGILSI